MKLFFQIVSWVFLPLMMPIYALLLVMFVPSNQDFFFNEDCMYTIPFQWKKAFLSMFATFSLILPLVSYAILLRFKMTTSLEMDDRKERGLPIIIMLIYCLVLYYFFVSQSNNVRLPKFVYSLPLSGAFVTAVFYVLNKWKKISIHAAGTGILTGFILAYILQHTQYELWMFTLAIFVSGLVMTARIYLGKHNIFELVIGWFTGTFITFAINYFY